MKTALSILTLVSSLAFAKPIIVESKIPTNPYAWAGIMYRDDYYTPDSSRYANAIKNFYLDYKFNAKILKIDEAHGALIAEAKGGSEYGAWNVTLEHPEVLRKLKLGQEVTIKGLIPGSVDLLGDRVRGTSKCSSVQTSFDDIAAQANASKSHLEFLQKIPAGAADRFTFVHTSHSLQADGASYDLPRVIRFSDDGKTTYGYVCDPKSKTYNEIEVLHFDDQTQSYTMAQIDFNTGGSAPRITKNPPVCLRCHGQDPKPLWAEYSSWRGAYGAEDDIDINERAVEGPENHYSVPKKLRDSAPYYTTFKRLQKNNPCYSSLPWPKENPSDPFSVNFPYTPPKVAKPFSIVNRVNTHYALTAARLNARRLAHRMMNSSAFKNYGAAFMGLAFNCSDVVATVDAHLSPTSGAKTAKYAVLLSPYLGISKEEWQLSGLPNSEYFGGDFGQVELMTPYFLDFIIKSHPEFSRLRENRSHYNAFLHGSGYKCFDDLGDKMVFNTIDHRDLCAAINADAKDELKSVPPIELTNDDSIAASTADPVPGYKIMQKRCAKCHDGTYPESPNFKTWQSTYESVMKRPLLKSTLSMYVSTGFMPHDGSKLTTAEKKTVIGFIEGIYPSSTPPPAQ